MDPPVTGACVPKLAECAVHLKMHGESATRISAACINSASFPGVFTKVCRMQRS